MDYSIAWLADDLSQYLANDVLRVREPSATLLLRQEWTKYAAEANKGLKNLRLISLALLLSYRNGPTEMKFQNAEFLTGIVPPSWMSLKYLFPAL